MAQYNVTLNYTSDPFTGDLLIINAPNGGLNSNDPLVLSTNDTVLFTNNSNSSASVSGQSTSRYNTANLTVPANGTATLTALSNYTNGLDTSTISIGGASDPFYLSATGGSDTVPDPFDIGVNVSSAQLSTVYEFLPFLVKGITNPSSIAATGCQFKKGSGGTWVTNSTVVLNDEVYVRATSSPNYFVTTGFSINIGGITNSSSIRTKLNPSDGTRLYFPKTVRPISLTDVSNFFAAPVNTPNTERTMSAFRRGGLHVPDIVENAGIVDTNQSNDLVLGQFLTNTATVFTFDSYPENKWVNIGEGGARSGSVSWTAVIDWELGYSPLTKYNAEYRYEYTQDMNASGDLATFSSSGASIGDFSVDNTTFTILGSAPSGLARFYSGKVTIFMRSLIDNNVTVSTEVEYQLSFQGDL